MNELMNSFRDNYYTAVLFIISGIIAVFVAIKYRRKFATLRICIDNVSAPLKTLYKFSREFSIDATATQPIFSITGPPWPNTNAEPLSSLHSQRIPTLLGHLTNRRILIAEMPAA